MQKLLLIDDDEELCVELTQILATEGYKVDVAFDGLQGLQFLQEKYYQMIILDLKLPKLNGYEVLKGIRTSVKTPKVIILSGRPLGDLLLNEQGVDLDEEERVLRMADLVVNKPFMIEEFIQKIKILALTKVEESQ